MSLPTLDPHEVRVLGALAEKALATPDGYPLTLNSLRSACNQKSSRDPVMDLSDREVSAALDRLGRRGLVGTASGAGHRTVKYRHTLDVTFGLSRHELATLALLMLRGAQTPGEIRSRSGRMAEMGSVSDAEEALWLLSERDEPLVSRLPRSSGQAADRYRHTLAAPEGDNESSAIGSDPAPDAEQRSAERPRSLSERVSDLETIVSSLRDELAGLRQRLGDAD